jgi:hypothetical protein
MRSPLRKVSDTAPRIEATDDAPWTERWERTARGRRLGCVDDAESVVVLPGAATGVGVGVREVGDPAILPRRILIRDSGPEYRSLTRLATSPSLKSPPFSKIRIILMASSRDGRVLKGASKGVEAGLLAALLLVRLLLVRLLLVALLLVAVLSARPRLRGESAVSESISENTGESARLRCRAVGEDGER